MPLSDHARKLLDGGNILTVATINPDGSPQTTTVWCRTDGDDVVFSTIRGRRKHRNLERDPRVSISVFDPTSPFDRVEIRGRATITDDPRGTLIDELSHRYTGRPWLETDPSAKRVIVRVNALNIVERRTSPR
ncbi:PPOX class F420-dependent oxidoreductase [Promicromonospora sp. NPDC090134]|uniref:PPOX class F420-dependent oxidoreductase n=1 Tax=Promicromonospora sp. NPDC090134 TaxID=3364408 RepID=UPI003823A213